MKIANVQYLRFIAATLVVCGHAFGAIAGFYGPRSEMVLTLGTGAGVDLFFAISGFIMVHTSMRHFGTTESVRSFLVRRIARIVPLYWGATILFSLPSALGGHGRHSPLEYATSLLFIPYDAQNMESMFLFPILSLGWTLNYEFLFYIIFAATLALPWRPAILISISSLLGLVAAGALMTPALQPLYFWTRPIILEFILGMSLAVAVHRGLALPAWGRCVVVCVAVTLWYLNPLGDLFQKIDGTNPNNLARVFGWGLPMAMLLAAGVLAREHPERRLLRPVEALGDASYSIYLLHPFVLIAATKIMKASNAAAFVPMAAVFSLVMLAIYAISLVSYRFFERPSARLIQAWLEKRRPSYT